MIYFKTLILEDFQSHKNTVLDFHSGFNSIVGASNMGKTAITRALAFILYGEWDKSWVRHGAKFSRISLVLNNNTVIIREKGEKVNKYILQIPNQKEQIFENFGTEIPEDIKNAFKVYKVQVDANEFLNLNFANQLDPLFLLSKTGSFKAKVIGKLSDAHYLDYALRELNKDKRALSSEKTIKESEVLTLKTQLKEFDGLEHERARLEELRGSIASLEAQEERLERLKSLFLRAQSWKAQYTSACDHEALLGQVSAPSIDPIEALANRVKALSELNKKLTKLTQKESELWITDIKLTENLGEAKANYAKILTEEKVCPTCYSPLSKEQICSVGKSL